MIKTLLPLSLLGLCTFTALADDTIRAHHLRELEVMGIKQMPDGGLAREAITEIGAAQIRRLDIVSPKDISAIAPNFYMPSYGSRMTSSIYVRGLGARLDQPVVGLSVDNIPYLNKDAFDSDVADIRKIEVLRGSQAVLNGRNTMAGQINIHTLSPLNYQGLRAMSEYSSGNSAKASLSYYGKISQKVGMSLAAQFKHSDGFYTNSHNGEKLGRENSGSLRWKTAARPSDALSLTNTAVASLVDQFGYPYSSLSDGKIAYDDTCAYSRRSLADAFTVAWASKRVVVSSVTSVHYLDDCLQLDNDFTTLDYFSLRQSRKEFTFTQDLFTRGARGKYSWLGGVFAFYRINKSESPVTFKDTGIAQLIEKHRNQSNPDYPIAWDTRRFVLNSDFTLYNSSIALYHESTLSLGDWRFEGGLRFDIERAGIDYDLNTATAYTTYHRLPDGEREVYSHNNLNISQLGDLTHIYVEILPKFTISHKGAIEPYLTFSKGCKAGGYNTQMFSDVLQQDIMAAMGLSKLYSIEKIISYKPERSYNYEVGVHCRKWSSLTFDALAFFIDCKNQQLTVFPRGNTTGRVMTNAGITHSFGTELSCSWTPVQDLGINASYGYTNARFKKYHNGISDFCGKTVPYAPRHTLFAEANWTPEALTFKGISPSLNLAVRGVGQIFWNESNTASQAFYALPSASLAFSAEKWSLRLWASNFTDTRYDVFYFMSMNREFVQKGLPRQFGATLRFQI